tara:strand:+ start:622 stop:819 length:198 start_codon:yes stop_codon:yes gene_type:complete
LQLNAFALFFYIYLFILIELIYAELRRCTYDQTKAFKASKHKDFGLFTSTLLTVHNGLHTPLKLT